MTVDPPIRNPVDEGYAKLFAALENLSTLKMTESNPKFRVWIWDITSRILECLLYASKGRAKYFDIAESNIRVMEALYHSTPQGWRQLVAHQQVRNIPMSQEEAQPEIERLLRSLPKPTLWEKFRDTLIFQPIGVIIGAVGTFLILRLLGA